MAKPALSREPWFQAAFVLVTLAGLTIVGATAQRAAHATHARTAPRRLAWYGADGQRLEEGALPECDDDGRFRTLLYQGSLWMVCLPSAGWPAGAYARLDPAASRALLAWPLPDELSLRRTEGLAPGPDGLLAIVYRAEGDDELVVGVADVDGWARPPEVVDARADSVLLGLDWFDMDLELVTAVTREVGDRPTWNRARVLTVPPRGAVQPRALDPGRICDPQWLQCEVQAALRQPGARVWRFLVSAREPTTLWSVVETGLRHPLEGVEFPWDARQDVDLTAVGVLIELTLRLQARLTAEGDLRPLDASDRSAFAGWAHDYTVVDGRLAWRHQYRMGEEALLLELDHELLGVERSAGRPDDLRAYRMAGDRVVEQHTVATTPPECAGLRSGALVPRRGGGYWLVSSNGCYLTLGPDLDRTDALTLWEHLRTRGSRCLGCDAGHLVAFFVWIMLGLPVCLGVSLAFVWRRRRRGGQGDLPIYPLLTVAVLVYDVSGAFMVPPLLAVLTG